MKLLPVHYRGAAPALTDVIAGHVNLMSVSVSLALPPFRTGKIKIFGIGSSKRLAPAADIPTVAESGLPGYEATTWFGLFATAGTPREIVMKINAEVAKILADPQFREKFLAPQMFEPMASSPEAFALGPAEMGKASRSRALDQVGRNAGRQMRAKSPLHAVDGRERHALMASTIARAKPGQRAFARHSSVSLRAEPHRATEPQRRLHAIADREADGVGPPHADRLGEIMHAEKAEAETDERRLRVREHGTGRPAADARMQDHDEAPHHDREHGEHAGGERADPVACRRHHRDDQRGGRSAQRDVCRAFA